MRCVRIGASLDERIIPAHALEERCLLYSVDERRGCACSTTRAARTRWRRVVVYDRNRLTCFSKVSDPEEGGERIVTRKERCMMLPFARIPSNCFLALVASSGVSKEMTAMPDERPLRSYFKGAKNRNRKFQVSE